MRFSPGANCGVGPAELYTVATGMILTAVALVWFALVADPDWVA